MIIRNKEVLIGAGLISLAAMLWGLDGVLLTPRLHSLDVAYVVFMLHAIPFAIMNVFFYKKYSVLKTLSRREALAIIGVAIFGGALGTLAIVKALFLVNFNHLSIVVLIQKLQPVFAIFLAYVLLHEKMGKNFEIWAAVAIAAGYLLAFEFSFPNFDTGANTALAALYALVAAMSFGSSTVLSKMALSKLDFKAATFFRYGFTTLIMGAWVLLTGRLAFVSETTQTEWIIFLIIGLTTGSGAIFIYYYGLMRVRAIISTICELFMPVSAIIFDYVFNGNALSLVQWASAIVMMGAIVKINIENAETKKQDMHASQNDVTAKDETEKAQKPKNR